MILISLLLKIATFWREVGSFSSLVCDAELSNEFLKFFVFFALLNIDHICAIIFRSVFIKALQLILNLFFIHYDLNGDECTGKNFSSLKFG